MKVFLSYAFSDTEIMTRIKKVLEGWGIETYVAAHDLKPGEHLDSKIERAIEGCDALIALITKSASTSPSVNEETVFAKAKKVCIIPLVEEGSKIGVLLQGLEYMEFDPERISEISQKIARYLLQRGRMIRETEERPSLVEKEVVRKEPRRPKPGLELIYRFTEEGIAELLVSPGGNIHAIGLALLAYDPSPASLQQISRSSGVEDPRVYMVQPQYKKYFLRSSEGYSLSQEGKWWVLEEVIPKLRAKDKKCEDR